ncbi:integrator complex subunit 8 isoform X2 [Oratosquilla oratoria]|uniref:integrator complex subunit 8 isoform X2 n=1 Tax=Oratosquilla oratoria TaxID=337810 RepID=UPI003F771998
MLQKSAMTEVKLAWFEFLIDPSKLEQHLEDADSIDLIVQFIYNSSPKHETNADNESVEPSIQEVNSKKKAALAILALKTAAFLNWDLELLETKLPLHMLDSLLVALLHETLDEMSNPTSHGNLDTGPLKSYQLFSVAVYHRYALRALVKAKLPTKPVRVSNVPIPGQQDPTHVSHEVQEGILNMLERGAETSIRILEQLLGAGEVRAPTYHTFTPYDHCTVSVVHDWNRCSSVADEQFKCQIHYDLGTYHFLQEQYEDAVSHFEEAKKLLQEAGASVEFCGVDKKRLDGYILSCGTICGRKTPVEKLSLLEQFHHSTKNRFQGLLDVLAEDNLVHDIPMYLRLGLELDLVSFPEKAPKGFAYRVQAHNTVRNVLEGQVWNSTYPTALIQIGKEGAQFLIEVIVKRLPRYTSVHKERLRMFIFTITMQEAVQEVLLPLFMSSTPLVALFSKQEIGTIWPIWVKEEKMETEITVPFSTSDPSDITWNLIHSYDPKVLKECVKQYNATKMKKSTDGLKREIHNLNVKWELPIPVFNTVMKLSQGQQRDLVYLLIAKSQELALAKSYDSALDLLAKACDQLSSSSGREPVRLHKLLMWMVLRIKIQRNLHYSTDIRRRGYDDLVREAKQCISSLHGREGVVPWTSVVNCCMLLLLNASEWDCLLNTSFPSHLGNVSVAQPLAATAQALYGKMTNKKVWYELWDVVCGILMVSLQHKRSISGQSMAVERHQDSGVLSRSAFLEFLSHLKEATCLSIIISLLGRILNILLEEPNQEIHTDHLAMWPSTVNLLQCTVSTEMITEMLSWLVNYATKLYPTPTEQCPMAYCASWQLTRADLAYMSTHYHQALAHYITAIFIATDYLRNDPSSDQSVMNDGVLKRMIRCCMRLNCYTQAAILCQFLETIDYSTALRCLQERNSVDAMDAYYNCLWDVTLIEFIINMHQKRGEIQRRDKAMAVIGLLELNSNNNEEIQREAAKVRKHRFLRAMAKQYL